jgi:hypothetical protein
MQALMSRLDPEGLKGKCVADSPPVEVTHNASVAEVCQRLDRLEAVCVRIETSLNKALESFDRRIELLEARQNVGPQPGNASYTGSSPIAYESRFAPGLEAQVSNPYSTHTSGQGHSIFEGASTSNSQNISPTYISLPSPFTSRPLGMSLHCTSLAIVHCFSP